MGIPYIVICAVIIVIYVNMRASRAMRRDEEIRRSFWEREHRANATRKKSLDNLAYIRIPQDLLPEDLESLPEDAKSAAERITRLREEEAKIVNLTGFSNTDLKLEYGTANITDLTQFDAHYTLLATSLQECGKALYEEGRYEEAERVLSFAAGTGTDVAETYRLLIDMYRTKRGLSPEEARKKIEALMTIAEGLRSLSADRIKKMIGEALTVMGAQPAT